MSGGAFNYVYHRVEEAADLVLYGEDGDHAANDLEVAFAEHLRLVAAALRDVEWVRSGDLAPGDADAAVKAVFEHGSTRKSKSIRSGTKRESHRQVPEMDLVDLLKYDALIEKGVLTADQDEHFQELCANAPDMAAEILALRKRLETSGYPPGGYVPCDVELGHQTRAEIAACVRCDQVGLVPLVDAYVRLREKMKQLKKDHSGRQG